MSDNKLAFKGTPGEWNITIEKRNNLISVHTGETSHDVQNIRGGWDDPNICGLWYHDIKEAEANAHLISAAPEAVEFIADLLEQNAYMLDEVQLERAEIILKKAYNF